MGAGADELTCLPAVTSLYTHRQRLRHLENNSGYLDCAEHCPADCSAVLPSPPISGGSAETKDCTSPATCPSSRLTQHFQDSHVAWYRRILSRNCCNIAGDRKSVV